MMEVYVLYGRDTVEETVYDDDGNYYGNVDVVEVFSTFEKAKARMLELMKEAIDYMLEHGNFHFDDVSQLEYDAFEDKFLQDYYPDEGEFSWSYFDSTEGGDEGLECLEWQMYGGASCALWDNGQPLLPGFKVEKLKVQ